MTDLQVYQPLPLMEIIEISKAFQASGFFKDATDVAKCIVKVQAGNEIGIPPFAAMTGIHIIQGKPTIGAGIMAAKVKSSNKYDYEVVEHTSDVCSINFVQFVRNTKGGIDIKKLGNSTFTSADAVKAGTQNMAKFPKNMLFARAISNGVKTYTPDIFAGPVYTPEEFDQVTEDTAAQVTTAPGTTQGAAVAQMIEAAKPIPKPELNALHPDWVKVVEFVKGGGVIADLSARYVVSSEVTAMLQTAVPIPVAKPALTTQHPDYVKCVDFLKAGAKVDDLRVRYDIDKDAVAQLLVDSSVNGPAPLAFKPF